MCMQLSLSRGDKWDPSPSDETVDLISSLDRPAFEVVNFDFLSLDIALSYKHTGAIPAHTHAAYSPQHVNTQGDRTHKAHAHAGLGSVRDSHGATAITLCLPPAHASLVCVFNSIERLRWCLQRIALSWHNFHNFFFPRLCWYLCAHACVNESLSKIVSVRACQRTSNRDTCSLPLPV